MSNNSYSSTLTSIQILKKIGKNITGDASNHNISDKTHISGFIDHLTTNLSTFHTEKQPKFIHLAGIPGAGKSTYAQKILIKQPLFYVSFDEIMESYSGYQSSVKICAKQAFTQWETPAKRMGYELLMFALEKKVSILFDHSAANYEHLALLKALQRENLYHIEMHLIKASPEQVLARVKNRERLTQRHTPKNLIFTRHKLLKKLIPEYQKNVHQFVEINPNSIH